MRHSVLAFAILGAALLVGCATPPPANDPDAVAEFKENNDPLEPTNRFFYQVNDALDTVLLKPIALGYRALVPSPLRTGVHNALGNLGAPVVFANDVMQARPQRARVTLTRFIINSTAGLGGLVDVAADLGFPAHDSDFGITLAIWGLPDGAFLYLPVLGPSNPRDAVGFGVDTFGLDPWGWIGKGDTLSDLRLARTGLSAVDARVGFLDDFDKVKAQALDPYATIRSLSRQYRKGKIDAARADDTGIAVKKSP